MKKYITKRNYPLWLLLVGFICSLTFMLVLDKTPGSYAFFLQLLLFIGDSSLIASTVVFVVRGFKGILGWVKEATTSKERTPRLLALFSACLFSAPFLFYWFAMLFMAFGFLSIAIQQRQMYH